MARFARKRLNAVPQSAITRLPSSESSTIADACNGAGIGEMISGYGDRKGTRMRIKASAMVISFVATFVVLAGAVGIARAEDEWFVLGEKSIKTADQGVEIKSEGGRWAKDVKKTKLSVEGADVEIVKVVLNWDNRGDDTVTDIGVLKAGGESLPKDAPGRKGRLKGATIQYKILGDAPTATVKLWGYD